MPGVPKPGVDWASIEIAYRGGEKLAHLAARHDVTRQAIQNRAKRHGWVVTAAAEALTATATAERLREPETAGDRRIIANGKRTLANMEMVLEVLISAGSLRLAAQRIGMSPNGLIDWMKADEDFARMASAAEAEAGLRAVEQVQDAARRGDWRPAAYLLERLRATREDFAPVPAGTVTGPAIPPMRLILSKDLIEGLAARVDPAHPRSISLCYEGEGGQLVEVQPTGAALERKMAPVLDHAPEDAPHG